MEKSKIGWLNGGNTFNPWIGCAAVSTACANCYARRENARRGWCKDFSRDRHVTSAAYWRQPFAWNRRSDPARPTLVFCGSLCDVFERDSALWEPRQRLWNVIDATPRLRWLLLTKRPQNIREMTPPGGLPLNVWLGVTAENRKAAEERIPVLLDIPCAGRFVSCEPLLETIDIERWLSGRDKLDWVIAGGESGNGPGIRETTCAAFKWMWRDCRAHGVPFFFKQFGDQFSKRLKKRAEFAECREWPESFNAEAQRRRD